MNTGGRARHEGDFKVGLACACLKGEGEKQEGNGHMVRKESAVGKPCLQKKKGSLLGITG